MRILGVLVAMTMVFAAGCSAEEKEEPVSASADPVVAWRRNTVLAEVLRLRAWDASNADVIGYMHGGSTFYVDHVDGNTGMAFGYSYELGQSGWALASELDVVIGSGSEDWL
jgi:hypothetical protein